MSNHFYDLDMSLTPDSKVMSCARSLVVDTLPIHKQQTGAAWCKSLMEAVSSRSCRQR